MARNKYPEVTVGRILDVSAQLFLKKGYEKTTIQDIINDLGDLSKGAIYHHFKSKEEIIDAVTDKMFAGISTACMKLKNDTSLNGLDKIRHLILISLEKPTQDTLAQIMPNLINNPKLLAKQIDLTINVLAHDIIEPYIHEGINDGSIKTDFPVELAEVIALLINVWLNPLIFNATTEELQRKCLFFSHMTESMGIVIFDDEIIQRITCLSNVKKSKLP